jgi:hypothetical protein
MNIDCADAAGTVGLALETNEHSIISRCRVTRAAVANIALFDSYSCVVRDCSASNSAVNSGIAILADGNTVGGANNVIEGGTIADNGIGVYVPFGADTVVQDVTFLSNGTAVQTDSGSVRLTLQDCEIEGVATPLGGVGFVNQGQDARVVDCVFQNLSQGIDATHASGTGLDLSGCAFLGAFANAIQSNVDILATGIEFRTVGAINVWLINSGHVRISQSLLRCGNASNVINVSGVLYLDSSTLVAGGGGIGVEGTSGSIRIGDDVDLTGCTTGINLVAAHVNRGTFVLNPGGPPTVVFADLRPTDTVKCSLSATGGTGTGLFPAIVPTPGVGFVPTGPAGDTSTWFYEIS